MQEQLVQMQTLLLDWGKDLGQQSKDFEEPVDYHPRYDGWVWITPFSIYGEKKWTRSYPRSESRPAKNRNIEYKAILSTRIAEEVRRKLADEHVISIPN